MLIFLNLLDNPRSSSAKGYFELQWQCCDKFNVKSMAVCFKVKNFLNRI